jgi:signal transduction histidine kinase/DNA-binding response OmpR family regulator
VKVFKFSSIRLAAVIIFTYAAFIFGLIWADNVDYETDMRIDLTKSQVYLSEGTEVFTANTYANIPKNSIDLTGKSWSIYKTEFADAYRQPMFTPTDLPVRDYTYTIYFDVTASNMSYLISNALVPGLFLDSISDNWDILVNGNIIKREMHLDKSGQITTHRNVTAISIPFDKSYLHIGKNVLTIHVKVNPNTEDSGLYYSQSVYIDEFDSLQLSHNDFFLIFFSGISAFMGFYYLLVFANSHKDYTYLYFAIVVFILSLYIFMNASWVNLLIENSQLRKVLEFSALTVMPVFGVLFTKSIAKEKINIPFKILCVFTLVIAAAMYFVGIQCSVDLLMVGEALVFILLSYCAVTAVRWIIRAAKADSEKVKLSNFLSVTFCTVMGNNFLGILFVFVSAGVGVYRSNIAETEQNVVILGLFAFVLAVSFALANEVAVTKRFIAHENEYLENMVEDRTRALEEQTRIAVNTSQTKSRFLATMSHEIRTPMNAIIGISEILLANPELDSKIREAIAKIHHSGQGLLAIINDILDLSKAESGKLELNLAGYSFASLINDTIVLNIIRIEGKPIKFSMEITDGVPEMLIGDELRVKQVISNILSNAFKYTDRGEVKLIIEPLTDDSGIKFTVSDTGLGMREEEVKTLFDEYSRFNKFANRRTEGTGLGMNITGRLVKLMNGTIKVESEYGKGSTFIVSLPQGIPEGVKIMSESLRRKLCSFTYAEIEDTQNIVADVMPYGKVLIVDDVETNLYVAEGLMNPYGISIVKALSGFEAIDIIVSGEIFDIIFMDHMMPVMDGIETVKKIRQLGYKGCITALTANAIVGNEQLFTDNGFDDFLSKPIDAKNLNNILCKYIKDRHPEEAQKYNHKIELPNSVNTVNPIVYEGFIRDSKHAVEVFEDENTTLENLCITAHGIKSAAANAGDVFISQMALELELASKEKNTDEIPMLKIGLITMLKEIIGDEPEAVVEDAEDHEIPADKIAALKKALDEYDEQKAGEIITLLNEEGILIKQLNKISEFLLHADYEAAADYCGEMLKQ